MNLSQLRQALTETRVLPVKTLGQNFLHDQNLVRWIVSQAQIQSNDFVVEIGPGFGALTAELLRGGARVLALEKDLRLVSFLRETFSGARLEVQHCDALRFDPRVLFAEHNVKLIGNLPYYIASQLLLHFLSLPSPIELALLMLQDEMARRLSATPRSPEYGALTLKVQSHYSVEYLRKIPASVFFPRPEVASALVRFAPRSPDQLENCDYHIFRELVRLGFSQRRKQLGKLLAHRCPDWENMAGKLGVSPFARAEELSREQWIELSNLIEDCEKKSPADSASEIFPVVDENDREIGRAPRAEVHANNLRHRAVHILVFNRAGEVLLQKRSRFKDRHPLLWDSSAAGHVEAGETYDQTAARELHEELGVTAKLTLITTISASERTGHEFIHLYRAECDGLFSVPRNEISAVVFFPPGIVERWIANKPEEFAPGFLECWKISQRSARAGGTPTCQVESD
ncbi:MAG: ribosomal RNA small subunit methyltransferase A [Verrucomicrobia bacterium]|nr:ribosomal RNA small subunit methyltransferase A [Verrucomicrobiota bacterium]